MSRYQLHKPPNQKDMEKRVIQQRIDQLTEKQWSLTGHDYRRCKLSIEYNRQLLEDPNATVRFP